MTMKRILITGGSGFIGFHLAKELQQEGHELTLIDNFSRNAKDDDFNAFSALPNIKFIEADMTEKLFYKDLTGYYDEIYHLAAINGTRHFYEKPYEVLRVNILSLINMLEWVTESNTGKFLFTSSSEAYAGTINEFGSSYNLVPSSENIPLCINDVHNSRFSYGGSKIAGELLTINYFKHKQTPFTIVRYHNVYGPRMGFDHVIPEFCKRIYLKENPFELFGGEETRAFCYIADAVEATILTMRSVETNQEIIHIGNSLEEIRIVDLAALLIRINKFDTSLKINPAPEGSVNRRCPDTKKLNECTGFIPKINLHEGLLLTLTWYNNKYQTASTLEGGK